MPQIGIFTFNLTNQLWINPFTLYNNNEQVSTDTPWNMGIVSYVWVNKHININVMRQYWLNIMKGMVHSDGFWV